MIKTKLQAVAGQEKIRRPTCIDGLTFDQFALLRGRSTEQLRQLAQRLPLESAERLRRAFPDLTPTS